MNRSTTARRRFLLFTWLERWILQRIEKRRAPTQLPHELEHRTIFVVPTVFGLGFGLLLVFMALGGLNFNNNLALMLVFLLGVIAQMTTLMAYRNLKGLRVESVRCEPVFAGDLAQFIQQLQGQRR